MPIAFYQSGTEDRLRTVLQAKQSGLFVCLLLLLLLFGLFLYFNCFVSFYLSSVSISLFSPVPLSSFTYIFCLFSPFLPFLSSIHFATNQHFILNPVPYSWDEPTLLPELSVSVVGASCNARYNLEELGSGERLYYYNPIYIVLTHTFTRQD